MGHRAGEPEAADDKRAAMLSRMAKARAARAAKRSAKERLEHVPAQQTVLALAESWRRVFIELIGIGVFIAATALFICGGMVLARESIVWLKIGKWETVTTYDLWYRFIDHPPHLEWVGLAQVFDWVLSSPLSGFLMLLGIGLYILLFIIIANM